MTWSTVQADPLKPVTLLRLLYPCKCLAGPCESQQDMNTHGVRRSCVHGCAGSTCSAYSGTAACSGACPGGQPRRAASGQCSGRLAIGAQPLNSLKRLPNVLLGHASNIDASDALLVAAMTPVPGTHIVRGSEFPTQHTAASLKLFWETRKQ